jgi:micrococcal nuclease
MKGSFVQNLNLIRVIDGDTIKVRIENEQESIRLICLDTEESRQGGSKPVTNAGRLASQWAKEYFGTNDRGIPIGDVRVDLEFDTNDPLQVCLRKHRGNYGRLICYVYKAGHSENFNVRIVREGWSPYFVKYGRSRLYHREFLEAEAAAQSSGLGIWNPATNASGKRREYASLVPWWHLRDTVVQGYRNAGRQAGVLSVRLDYEDIVEAARLGQHLTVLCDLQSGVHKWSGNGALIYAGSKFQKFNLWIPDRDSDTAQVILRLIDIRYIQAGRSYVYVSGSGSLYPPTGDGKPQIVLTEVAQLADYPPGS